MQFSWGRGAVKDRIFFTHIRDKSKRQSALSRPDMSISKNLQKSRIPEVVSVSLSQNIYGVHHISNARY